MTSQQVFQPLSGDAIDNDDLQVTEIESCCLKCYENGTTRMLLTRIPFFKDIVISSFECGDPKCGYKNNEIMNAGKINENGVKLTFEMNDARDLHRNLVRSEFCSVTIPELQFEIPVGESNKGIYTTVEGLLNRAFDDIERDQPLRQIQQPEIAQQIDAFLANARARCGLKGLNNGVPSVTIIFNDPSGNSYVDNPHAPYPDNRLRVDYFVRSKEESILMGLHEEAEATEMKEAALASGDHMDEAAPEAHGGLDLQNEVLTIKSNCPSCNAVCDANFKTVNIPFFKEVIIMATVCDVCGYKSNNVTGGSGFSEKGQKIVLTLNQSEPGSEKHKIDLARDTLKSETASIAIPNLDFEIGRGAIEGKFTTVEGILQDIQSVVRKNPFTSGDAGMAEDKSKVEIFCKQIDSILDGSLRDVKLVLDDPAGNSYVQNINAPDVDPDLETVEYERTEEQNEDLGLTYMKTENYDDEEGKNAMEDSGNVSEKGAGDAKRPRMDKIEE